MVLNDLLFYDLETTSVDIFKAEIITGYFLDSDGNEYHMKSQVDNWSFEAQEIHGITENEMLSYPGKIKAHKDAFNYLKKYEDHLWICYANPKTIYGTITYDRGVLINCMLETLGEDLKIENHLSVYNLVKLAEEKNLFAPIKGKKGRKSYSQKNVYKAIFNSSYDAHNAKADVIAMKRIYEKITQSLINNSPISGVQNNLI